MEIPVPSDELERVVTACDVSGPGCSRETPAGGWGKHL